MMDPAPDGSYGAVTDAGDLLVAHPLIVEQQDRDPLRFRQPFDRAPHLVTLQPGYRFLLAVDGDRGGPQDRPAAKAQGTQRDAGKGRRMLPL